MPRKKRAKELRPGRISLRGENPVEFLEEGVAAAPGFPTVEQASFIRSVERGVMAYLKESKKLLSGKLAHLSTVAPPYLVNRGNVLIACCPDGVIIRYETNRGASNVIVGWMKEDLLGAVRLLSQDLVYCHRQGEVVPPLDARGHEIYLRKTDPSTGDSSVVSAFRVGLDWVIPDSIPVDTSGPFRLLSVRSTFDIQLRGYLAPEAPGREPQNFLLKAPIKLPVGWECIEVFPGTNGKAWKPGPLRARAESDILSAVLAQQSQDNYFASLDPKLPARKRYSLLLEEYRLLLESSPDEEALQVFLRKNPSLLCPSYMAMWPKQPLGATVTDFIFRDATGDYLLVEIEKANHSLFTKSGHPTHQLQHAISQVRDWRRYLEDNLGTVQRELGLHGISANPRGLVVIGRSSQLDARTRRTLTTMENEAPKTKIMTYDDVYLGAKAVVENLLGPLWNVEGNTQVYYLP